MEEPNTEPIRKRFEELDRLYAQQDKDRIPYIAKAIIESPFSLHLYDTLCKVYGRLKQYDKILPLFEGGLSKVREGINALPSSPVKASDRKRMKLLRRMEADFKLRITQVGVRKQAADEFRAKMAEKDRHNNVNNSTSK